MQANSKKCSLVQKKLHCRHFILSNEGFELDPNTTEALLIVTRSNFDRSKNMIMTNKKEDKDNEIHKNICDEKKIKEKKVNFDLAKNETIEVAKKDRE